MMQECNHRQTRMCITMLETSNAIQNLKANRPTWMPYSVQYATR
jgi:hypothetical protein